MSYDTNLAANQQTSMPEMYKIRYGTTTYRYTSYHDNVTFLNQTYTAIPIKRGGLMYDDKFSAVTMNLDLAINDWTKAYIANQPIEPVTVIVYRALQSDLSDYEIIFSGRVADVITEDYEARIQCVARSEYLEKVIPDIIYQSYCNHDVYDDGCGLNWINWRVEGTITDITGSTITATEWAAYAADYFKGGYVKFGSDYRLVTTSTAGGVLTLQVPFDSRLEVGSTTYAVPGCDGDPETCINRFNNLTNFQGMPYIPSRNPTIWGLR